MVVTGKKPVLRAKRSPAFPRGQRITGARQAESSECNIASLLKELNEKLCTSLPSFRREIIQIGHNLQKFLRYNDLISIELLPLR